MVSGKIKWIIDFTGRLIVDENGVRVSDGGHDELGNRVWAQMVRIGKNESVVWNLIQGKLPGICEGDPNEKS